MQDLVECIVLCMELCIYLLIYMGNSWIKLFHSATEFAGIFLSAVWKILNFVNYKM